MKNQNKISDISFNGLYFDNLEVGSFQLHAPERLGSIAIGVDRDRFAVTALKFQVVRGMVSIRREDERLLQASVRSYTSNRFLRVFHKPIEQLTFEKRADEDWVGLDDGGSINHIEAYKQLISKLASYAPGAQLNNPN